MKEATFQKSFCFFFFCCEEKEEAFFSCVAPKLRRKKNEEGVKHDSLAGKTFAGDETEVRSKFWPSFLLLLVCILHPRNGAETESLARPVIVSQFVK